MRGQRATTLMTLKTDPLAWLLAPALGRAGGGECPFHHGKGLGMGGVLAAEAVSQLLGPPLKRSPHKSPHTFGDLNGGSAVGRLAQALLLVCSDDTATAAGVTACLAHWLRGVGRMS
jgi:hypothetical protein